MIRTLTIALAICLPLTALSAAPASAQVTEQTDKSEEDWRKSKKKRDASDIFEDILNTRSIGVGTNQYPQNPVDNLPEDSRRHLMKERAKVIAEADLETVTRAPYVPSEAAKSDPELAEQEKEAWTVIMTDLEGGGAPSQDGASSGPNKIAVAGQGGSSREPNASPMRGGSSASVADIMAQIKGMKAGGSRSGNAGNARTASDGNSDGASGAQGSQQQSENGTESGSQGSSGEDGTTETSSSDGQSSQSANAAQASGTAQSDADNAANSALESGPQTEPMSPLERIKAQRNENTSGSQTSALDYLNKDKD